jgi:hypothetical protein
MRRLHSIQDESILYFLSSLHEGENKKSEGEVGGMGALGAAPQQLSREVDLPPQPRMSDASDAGEETGEEESSLSDISIVVTSLEDDDDDDDDEYHDVGEGSASSTSSSTSSSFSSLSQIATTAEIDFDAEAEAQAKAHAQNAEASVGDKPTAEAQPVANSQLLPSSSPEGTGLSPSQAPSSGMSMAERRRSRSVENEAKARHQLQLPQRRGATNTEIYGSLRYSRKHAGAVQGPMDGSAIGAAVPLQGPADDSNFMRAIARRRELKKNPFGSVLALHDLANGGGLGGAEGRHENQTLRMKRLCFAEEKSAEGAAGGPRSIADRIPPLTLHRSADERLLQKRRLALSPRGEPKRTIEEAAPTLAASPTTYDDKHRRRGSSWTGKSKDDSDSKKKDKEKEKEKEKDKEKDKEKKRMGSLRILSPRRGSNSRAVGASKGGTVPASPRSDGRSLAGVSFMSPSMAATIGSKEKSSSQPGTPQMARAAESASSITPQPERARRNSDGWGALEDGGDEEWEFGQWLESEEGEEGAWACEGDYTSSKPGPIPMTASVVVKSYWSRGGRVSGQDTREDNEQEESAGQQQQRCRKLTMPPCRICFTKLDPDVRVHMTPFMQLLNQKHGATHKEAYCSFFVYQNEVRPTSTPNAQLCAPRS